MSHVPGGLVYKRFLNSLRSIDSGAPVPGGDPLYLQVLYLLHCDGPESSTAFIDNSIYARLTSAINGAAVTTANALYNQALGLPAITIDYLQTVDMTDMDIGTDDCTIELAFYTDGVFPGATSTLLTLTNGANAQNLSINLMDTGEIEFLVDGGSTTLVGGTWFTDSINRIAFCRAAGVWRAYWGGSKWGQIAGAVAIPASDRLRIGTQDFTTFTHYQGTIDEVRITAAARYVDDDYILPTEPYPDSL